MNPSILTEFISREIAREVDRRMAEITTKNRKPLLSEIRQQCLADINRMTDSQRERLKRGESLEYVLYQTVAGVRVPEKY
jgi:cell division protein ZapA (FtsZ GTPase activity inhibitor)